MKFAGAQAFARRKKSWGLTLVELMVAVALSSVVLGAVSTFWMFGLRSFASMTNYVDLDGRSRHALDLMTLEMRQATRLTGFQNTPTNKWITLTNADQAATIRYTWNQAARTLIFDKTGQSSQVFLTECDAWNFQIYQRSPQQSNSNLFFPATNALGVYDTSICKLVDMTWKCSRSILGKKLNTESVQTAQVVLRNKQ